KQVFAKGAGGFAEIIRHISLLLIFHASGYKAHVDVKRNIYNSLSYFVPKDKPAAHQTSGGFGEENLQYCPNRPPCCAADMRKTPSRTIEGVFSQTSLSK